MISYNEDQSLLTIENKSTYQKTLNKKVKKCFR